MYSQTNEEKYIVDYFKGNIGKFIEVGGYDPFVFSNTRKLIELGWSGIIVEPSPICFKRFSDEYQNNNNIILYDVALDETPGNKIFYESNGDAVGSLDISHKQKWEKGYNSKFNEITIKCESVSEFFTTFPNNQYIDFLSFDVEGLNYKLFSLIPDEYLNNLRLICIEYDDKYEEIRRKLESFNFNFIHRTGENLIMGK